MSLKHVLLASSAIIALAAPENASAQGFGFFDQRSERPRYTRPSAQHTRPTKPAVAASRDKVSSQKPAPAAAEPFPASTPKAAAEPAPVTAAPVAPPAPLTEEQIAAKAAVDELLQREAALWAAKDRPDPALARAAAEKHRQQDLLKAKEEAAAARRLELAEKNRGREEAKVAALNARPDKTGKRPANNASSHSSNNPSRARTDTARSNPNGQRYASDPHRRVPADYRTSERRR